MSIPVTIIGGYLGAGKTTLINQVLRQADGLRIAVLVNEFGALSIDEDLIEAQEGDVISIAGGCVCCAFGDNLIGAIADMVAMVPAPQHIVIEASGVAIPQAIAATLSLVAGVQLAGIVVLADAETVEARARDTYMGDTILRQISGADVILLTKPDLVEDVAPVTAWLQNMSDAAAIVATAHGRCPNAVVLGVTHTAVSLPTQGLLDHSAQYRSFSFAQTGETDAAVFAQALADTHLGLLRAKGFVRQPDGALFEVQVVGVRWAVSLATAGHGLVCIGLRDRIAEGRIQDLAARHGFHPSRA
ncbi:MAG: CobW family GTP-binding protein [Pseudomonadota bacterium]